MEKQETTWLIPQKNDRLTWKWLVELGVKEEQISEEVVTN